MDIEAPHHKSLTVSALNKQVKSLLESSFFSIRVIGEISNFVKPSSGHWYFTLKDNKSQVRCAMFRGNNLRVNTIPKEGEQIIVTGNVSLYEGRGDYQLICTSLERSGEGLLQLQFEKLKQKLLKEGLFSESHKQPLPTFPRTIGVVTSQTGAAIHDILSVLKRRNPNITVRIYPTAVQGAEAAQQIVKAIKLANKDAKTELLIVGRGGGSLEDLWSFNEESVAKAIYQSKLPIISAVGHEVDYTIADFVADLRAPTPSAAAELISPHQLELITQLSQLEKSLKHRFIWNIQKKLSNLNHLKKRLRHPGARFREQSQRLDELDIRFHQALKRQVQKREETLKHLKTRLRLTDPTNKISSYQQLIERYQQRLIFLINNRLATHKMALTEKTGRLELVSPLATLNRGYAIATNHEQEILRDTRNIKRSDTIHIRLQKGRLTTRVTHIEE